MGLVVHLRRSVLSLFFIAILLAPNFFLHTRTSAETNDGGFSIQVSPSPIIDTIKPGVLRSIEFQVRNTGTTREDLRVDLRKFTVSDDSGQINLTDDLPAEVKDWVTIDAPTFSLEPGASFSQKLMIQPPESVGFSYNFAIMITRDKEPNSVEGKTKIKASVAIFTLLTVDREGANRKFDIIEFSSKRRLYEYLPTEFSIKLKNTGNTIVQPYGNIYIQRSPTSDQPISVLKLNPNGAYLLPDVTRSLPVEWQDGFPVFTEIKSADNVETHRQLKWDFSKVQNLRFGRYYAKIVAVYNDGQRDVPIEATVSFWVIPWKLLIGITVLIIVLIIGVVTIIRKPIRSIKRKKTTKKHEDENSTD